MKCTFCNADACLTNYRSFIVWLFASADRVIVQFEQRNSCLCSEAGQLITAPVLKLLDSSVLLHFRERKSE